MKYYETRVPITSQVLRVKAVQLSNMMPMYQGQREPTWSNGWLEKFQKSHSIHKTRRYGESSSVSTVNAEDEINSIREALVDVPLSDIYNCDETGLFYKAIPDISLSTCQLPGHKPNKDRITAMHTVSAIGQSLKIWYIGMSRHPRCFRNIKIDTFNFFYRSNKKAWMNTEIMIEYLKWFDGQISGRKVILIIDNFSGHKAAFEYLNSDPSTMLKNTEVIFLPPSITSLHQPLDQGIIHSWKCHYRKKWLKYMIEAAEQDKDATREMDLSKAMRWGMLSWHFDPSLIEPSLSSLNNEAELVTLAQTVAWQRGIPVESIPAINDFVSPSCEEVLDDFNTLEEQFLEEMVEIFDAENCDENDEEDAEGLDSSANFKKVELHEAIAARRFMIKWEEQSGDGNGDELLFLNKDLRTLLKRQQNSRKQTTLTSFFSTNQG
ncbi:hypothetical protein K3495_g7512 [Podosphaera aphanis]|nr:hypothetical protein K3495_g7512 [Podosphaera aphanis]